MRASRTGVVEISEATASSPTQQVYLFSLTAASGEPNPSPLWCISQATLAGGDGHYSQSREPLLTGFCPTQHSSVCPDPGKETQHQWVGVESRLAALRFEELICSVSASLAHSQG